jgi:hypothetical protein
VCGHQDPPRGRFHALRRPAHVRRAPLAAVGLAVIAGLQPDMGEAGQRRLHGLRRPSSGDAIALHEVGWGHVHGAHAAWGGHPAVPRPALELLSAVIASLPASARRLDTLASNAASPRLGLPPQRDTEWRASLGVPSGPHVGLPPAPQVVLHGFPGGKVVGHAPPLAACAPPIEHRVANGAPRMLARAAGCSAPWQQRLEPWPGVIGPSCRRRETCHAWT